MQVIWTLEMFKSCKLVLHTSWWTWIFWSGLPTLVAGIPASEVHVATGAGTDEDCPHWAVRVRHTWNTPSQFKWHLRVRTNPVTIFGFPTSTLEAPTSSIATSWTCRQNYNQNKVLWTAHDKQVSKIVTAFRPSVTDRLFKWKECLMQIYSHYLL